MSSAKNNDRYNQQNIRTRHYMTATMQILRWLKRNGEGKEIRIVNRFCIAWNQGYSCVLSSHMPAWTCRCNTLLTTANRYHSPTAHSSMAHFTSGHLARSRCLACVVSHCPAKCSSSLMRHSKWARVLWW